MSGKKNITKYFLLLFLKQLTLGQPLGHNRALSLKELQIMLEYYKTKVKRIEKLWFVCKFKRTNSMIFVRYKRFHFMTTLFRNTILKIFTIPGVIVVFHCKTIYELWHRNFRVNVFVRHENEIILDIHITEITSKLKWRVGIVPSNSPFTVIMFHFQLVRFNKWFGVLFWRVLKQASGCYGEIINRYNTSNVCFLLWTQKTIYDPDVPWRFQFLLGAFKLS